MIVRFRGAGRDRMIGRRVQETRRRQRRTQDDLAKAMGLSHSMIGKLERGERHWTLEAVSEAALTLRVHPDFLLQESLDVVEAVRPVVQAARQEPENLQDVLDISMLDETDRTMIVAMHAVMARRTARLAA